MLARQAVQSTHLPGPHGREIPRAAGTAIIAACFIWSVAKGRVPVVHLDELYFWINSYGPSYVRRGLVGTLLGPLTLGARPNAILLGL